MNFNVLYKIANEIFPGCEMRITPSRPRQVTLIPYANIDIRWSGLACQLMLPFELLADENYHAFSRELQNAKRMFFEQHPIATGNPDPRNVAHLLRCLRK